MTDQVTVKVGAIEISRDHPFALIAGPCQLESRDHAMMMAERVLEVKRRGRSGDLQILL